jgi:hypothetical protein
LDHNGAGIILRILWITDRLPKLLSDLPRFADPTREMFIFKIFYDIHERGFIPRKRSTATSRSKASTEPHLR